MAVPRRRVLQAGLWTGLLSACGGEMLRVVPSTVAGPMNIPAERAAHRPTTTTDLPRNRPSVTNPADVPAVEVAHGRRSTRQVVLSFQGSGDAGLARDLLHEVERAHVRVTVLAVGQWLLAHPFIAHRILHGGHELGNQTYSHPADLARLTSDAAYEEIARCGAVLRKLTGSQGAWFRTTGSPHANHAILAAASRAGYSHALSYDVGSLDWTDPGPTPARIVAGVIAKVRPGSVVNLHMGHPGTVAALPQILDHLHQKGLTPVTAGEMFGVS